jgi:hypothetical protein
MAKADSTQPGESLPTVPGADGCKKPRRARDRAYYLANRDAILRRCVEYRKANAEKVRARHRAYYQKNRDAIAEKKKTESQKQSQKKRYAMLMADPIRAEKKRQMDRIYSKRYRDRNPEKEKEKSKRYRIKNRDAVRESARKLFEKDPERRRMLAAQNSARWRKRFFDKHGTCSTAARRRSDKVFRLVANTRNRIYMALKSSSAVKSNRTVALVGCSASQLFLYIESLFLDGMSWKNRDQWHIDHIIPLAKFDLSDPTQQAAAFHYTNLQPLWAKDNLRKSDKVAGQQCFGFAYAARIADAASAKPKRRRRYGGQHEPD